MSVVSTVESLCQTAQFCPRQADKAGGAQGF